MICISPEKDKTTIANANTVRIHAVMNGDVQSVEKFFDMDNDVILKVSVIVIPT